MIPWYRGLGGVELKPSCKTGKPKNWPSSHHHSYSARRDILQIDEVVWCKVLEKTPLLVMFEIVTKGVGAQKLQHLLLHLFGLLLSRRFHRSRLMTRRFQGSVSRYTRSLYSLVKKPFGYSSYRWGTCFQYKGNKGFFTELKTMVIPNNWPHCYLEEIRLKNSIWRHECMKKEMN